MALPQDVPFGQVVTAGVVRQALREVLTEHLPPVLDVVAVRSGFPSGSVPAPLGWGAAVSDPDLVADQPVGVVVCPGISGRPVRHSNGLYEMTWDAAAYVAVSARSADEGQALSEVYGAALRVAVLQHPSLGGLASQATWVDERHEEVAFDSGRSVWAATQVFQLVVEAAVDGYATAGPNPVIERYITTFTANL